MNKLKNTDFWIGLGLIITAVAVRVVFHYHKFDDAFITFRYSLNLLRGNGLVYNAGARVLGTTTPLFAVLLAGLGWVCRTENIPLLADCVNHLADGGSAVVLYMIGRRLWGGQALPILLALFFVFSFHSVFYSSTGMETSFYTFLVLFALERTLAGRLGAALPLAAAALLTRPDALLAILAIGVFMLATRRKPRLMEWAPAAAVLAVIYAWMVVYYGRLLPHSMTAKSFMCGLGKTSLFSLPNLYEIRMFLSSFLTKSHSQKAWINYLQLIPLLMIMGIGVAEIARRNRAALLLPGFGLLFFCAYMKANVGIFPWYLIPTIPYLVLMVFAGIKLVAERVTRSLKRESPRLVGAICAAMLFMQGMVFMSGTDTIPSAIARTMYPSHTEPLYREAAGIVTAAKKPYSVLASEIGFIGYCLPDATIIDAIGLTNPEVIDFYRSHPSAMPKDFFYINRAIVAEFQPDYIITLKIFMEREMNGDPAFTGKYEKFGNFTAPNYEELAVYRKRKI